MNMTPAALRPESQATHRHSMGGFLRRLAVTDLLVIVVAAVGAQFLRFGELESVVTGAVAARSATGLLYSLVTVAFVAGWMATLAVNDAYDERVIGHGPEEYQRVLQASFRFFAAVAILSYVFKLELARGYVALAFPAGTLALLLGRKLWRTWLVRRRIQGRLARSVLVVGDGAHLVGLVRALQSTPGAGYRVVAGCCGDGTAEDIGDIPVLGAEWDAAKIATLLGVDTVACTSSWRSGEHGLRELGWALEGLDIDFVVSPGLTDIAGPRVLTRPVAGLPLLHIEVPRFSGTQRTLKNLLDRSAAVVGLLVLSPLLLLIGLLIRRGSPGSALFRQERIGRSGEKFSMYKFRTMVEDAESMLPDVLLDAGMTVQPLYKLPKDPRVTRVGRVLRRYSLDELPQLLNVVRGEMSLVGPRPQIAVEVATYADDVRRRLLVKPGMTGLWQVNGRNDLQWDDAVRFDLYYVENWSVLLDLVILWRTLRAVRTGSGAY
jgi:exopolysaccharide biosynthesis polyprenyl glycosylphosphotransferase